MIAQRSEDARWRYRRIIVIGLCLLTGFGYKFGRTFGWYLIILLGFAAIYIAILGQQSPQYLTWTGFWQAASFSFSQFHSLPTSLVSEILSTQFTWNLFFTARLIETILGLLMEISFVAAIVQRLSDK